MLIMKKFLFTIVLTSNFLVGLTQVGNTTEAVCFEVPKTIKIAELNNIQISNNCLITSFSFQIFNRWGQLVREANKMTNPLIFNESSELVSKKKKKKKDLSNTNNLSDPILMGEYVYIIKYTLPGDSKSNKQTGFINFY